MRSGRQGAKDAAGMTGGEGCGRDDRGRRMWSGRQGAKDAVGMTGGEGCGWDDVNGGVGSR